MTWTTPFTATTNAVISSSSHNQGVRDNLLHLRALLPDPGAATYLLQASSTSGAAFVTPNGDAILTPSSVTGNSGSSAIGANNIHPNRLVDPGAAGLVPVSGGSAGSVNFSTVGASGLSSDAITEPKIDADNSPTDGYVLSYVSASGRMRWIATTSSSNLVPSGLIAMVVNAAAIPTAWTRESGLNGRFPVGDDLGVTFTSENNYGAANTHTHNSNSFTVSGSASGPNNTSSTATATGGGTHTDIKADATLSVTGTATGNTASASHLPLSRAYVFVRKD